MVRCCDGLCCFALLRGVVAVVVVVFDLRGDFEFACQFGVAFMFDVGVDVIVAFGASSPFLCICCFVWYVEFALI